MSRGYYGVGIWHVKTEANIGGLWRSAMNFGADFLFTIGRRYHRQSTDCVGATRHLPLSHFQDFADFREHIPYDCPLVGVELHPDATLLPTFLHPERCIYLLGAEDHGLSQDMLTRCRHLVQIPSARCLNVATAGGIVLYDRIVKRGLD